MMWVKRFLLLVTALLVMPTCAGCEPIEKPKTLSNHQVKLLRLAYKEGEKIGFPETMQAILWQESHAGEYGKTRWGIIANKNHRFGNKSYGVCGVTVNAVKDVFRKHPEVMKEFSFTEKSCTESIITALLMCDEFNIRIASLYFKIQFDLFKGSNAQWSKAVLSYNRGRRLVLRDGLDIDPQNYVKEVKKNMKFVIKYK